MQHKILTFSCDLKALPDTGMPGLFEGYGSVFGNKDLGGDVVMPGAFTKSLATIGMPAMLWQHEMKNPLGLYIECYEDTKGLYVKGQINQDVQQGKEAYSLLKQGALRGMSIGYYTKVSEWDENTNTRYLKEVDLFEISIVTFPMNQLAQVTNVKSATTEREFEEFLREAGYSRTQAKLITAKGFKNALQIQREVEESNDEGVINACKQLSDVLKRSLN